MKLIDTLRTSLQAVASNEQIALIKRVFSENFYEYRYRYLLAGVFMVIAALATGGTAYIVKDIVNSVFVADNFQQALLIGVVTIAIFFVKGFATYMQTVILARIGNSIIANVRMRVFTHLIKLPLSYFDRVTVGEVFIRANMGVKATNAIINTLIVSVGRDVLTLIALVTVMFIQEPLISLLTFLIGPVCVILIGNAARKTKKLAREQLGSLTNNVSILKESVTGISMIKTFTLEREMENRILVTAKDIQRQSDKMAGLSARTSPIMETIGGLVIGAIIIYTGWRGASNLEHVGAMMSFLTAFLLAYDPAKRLARLRVIIEPLIVSVNHMYELLDHEKPEQEKGDPKLTVQNGFVRFENVNFAYGEDMPTLKDVSLTANPNERIALVGESGSGKSTVFKLMLGLYPLEDGGIYLDDQSIDDLTLETQRQAISYVGQDNFLLSGTVYENIQLGRLEATTEEIEAAAKSANAYGFITELSDGFQTFVGENGAQLSGGQRQRIVIARAFLKNAPIILLDEATSALDAESEHEIEMALETLTKGRTTISISHRLATLQNSDRIYVMKDGKIVEAGHHADLVAQGGYYATLYELQFAGS